MRVLLNDGDYVTVQFNSHTDHLAAQYAIHISCRDGGLGVREFNRPEELEESEPSTSNNTTKDKIINNIKEYVTGILDASGSEYLAERERQVLTDILSFIE